MSSKETSYEKTVLEKAAERLETHGWIQEDFGPKGGPNCALGAIRVEEVGSPYVKSDAEAFCDRWLWGQDRYVERTQTTLYNDAVGRTKEEVQDLLIALAAEAREQGL